MSNRISLKRVMNQATEYKLLTERETKLYRKITIKFHWILPRRGWYKLNIDGAFKKGYTSGSIEGVFRNPDGNWILGIQMKAYSRAPVHTQLQALYQGLHIAQKMNLYPLEVETDATQVIAYITHDDCITYDSIIKLYMWLISEMGTVVIQHNFRQGNEVAISWPSMQLRLLFSIYHSMLKLSLLMFVDN